MDGTGKQMNSRQRLKLFRRRLRSRTTMQLNQLSMRTSLIIAMTVMGLLSVFFVLETSRVWHEFAVDNQRASVNEQVRVWLANLRKHFDTESRQIVQLAKSDLDLMTAVRNENRQIASKRLDKLHQHPFFKTGESELVGLQALGQDFNQITATSAGSLENNLNQVPGQSLRTQASRRSGAERHKPVGGICIVDKEIHYEFIQPLGEDPRAGYLQITYNMLHDLAAAETALKGLSLKLTLADGKELYKSARWPKENEATSGKLALEQTLNVYAPVKSVLNVAVMADTESFYASLADTERTVMLTAAIAVLLVMLIVWFPLQGMTVKPLQKLVTHLRRVRADKIHLGEHIMTTGSTEIAELGAGFNDITTRLKELYGSLESLAFTDPLTKLPNRTLFHDKLQQAIEEARRDYKPFALFLMDLDRFKDINDTLGHQVGDMLLQQVAARLRSKLRDIDTVARMGGDEFAILLPAVNDKHATMAARMLLQVLRAPFRIEEQSLDIGASIGIALYPDHGVDANILIQRADVAMYAAKHANSGHAFYDSTQDQHNPTRLTLLGELRHAVEQEQFVLYFQPKVNLKTSQVTGVEALIRWNHPRQDLMLPDTFIPLLEQT